MANLQISSPLTLKCGLTLPNRLVKAAMAEDLADKNKFPSSKLNSIYDAWGGGGWGMLLTGNVQVDATYLGSAGGISFNGSANYDDMLKSWSAWAKKCQRFGTPTLVQINHPGRQSPIGAGQRGLCQKNIAPSAIGLNFGDGLIPHTINAVVFGTPREMTIKDIEHVINAFVDTALLASKAGFAGVEVHAAHGYLLSQFLSSQSNKRTDDYGGSPTKRAKIVVEILRAIRLAVPREFCVGIKLNSVDHQSATDFQGCLEQLRLIADTEIDFLEISGGSYENPTMNVGLSESNGASNPSSRTVAREAFFLEFAQAIRRDLPDLPLMVTGGFRTRRGMETAISSNACDLVGLGRPAVMDPKIPKTLFLNPNIKDEDASISVKRVPPSWAMRAIGVKALGAGTEHIWYKNEIGKIGQK